MTEANFDGIPLPPLGKLREFDVEEKANSRSAAEIPFTSPETDLQLAPAFDDLVGFAQDFQRKLGVEPTDIPPSTVHILSPKNMDHVAVVLGLEEENGGVYDPRADVVYVREPERREDTADLVKLFYAVSHELGHKLTPGLNGYYSKADDSFVLREGVADRFARDFIHDLFLPKYAPDSTKAITDQFRDGRSPYSFEGIDLRPDEIMLVDSGTRYATGFSRIVEARIVEQLEVSMGTDGFSELMRAGASTNILASRQVIISRLGIEAWNLLTTDPAQKPTIKVLEELVARNDYELEDIESLAFDPLGTFPPEGMPHKIIDRGY